MDLSPKAIFTQLCIIGLFLLVALVYFHPVLQGKAIFQSDIAQYKGMAKERDDHKQRTGQESYWTNAAFGGMPTYQLGANYPHDYIKRLDRTIRFLPRPADYLFLYFIGFYILLCCLKVDFRLAALGALAFGFSTYLIIILGVGHNAKAHALGYIPMVLGGIVLVFRKKYVAGFILTALAMALEIGANHYQMTYYFMLLVLILGLVYLVYAIREKELKHYFSSVGLLVLAVLLAIATNATGLMATKEYADWSTRGPSALTQAPDGSAITSGSGLDREYITQYSYGIAESLNLFVPRMFGGSGAEDLGRDSKVYEYLTGQGLPGGQALELTSGLPLYWGDQPIVAGPAYVGAIVLFLFVLGLVLVKGKAKWWLLFGALLSLMLSWGKNFPLFTDLMIDHFPLYNKFRAVSSIQVVLELCLPALGMLGLWELFRGNLGIKERLAALKVAFFSCFGLGALLLVFQGSFDFTGPRDEMYLGYYGQELMDILVRDREAVYRNDTIRSLAYVSLAALALWLFIREKIGKNVLVAGLGALILFDQVGVALRYVNEGDFVSKRQVEQPFRAQEVDRMIQRDDSHFRVFDPQEGLNGARTSYFHHSLGGYHAAKPRAMQELFEHQLYQGNREVLNMLNVKYIIQEDGEGQRVPALNGEANGNAWFVGQLLPVSSADQEIQKLSDIDSKKQAVVNTTDQPTLTKHRFEVDSLARIELVDYAPDRLHYRSSNAREGFAVFSEMYYPHGWQARVDGNPVPHYRVDYTLRGLRLPAGDHEIEFRFVPEVVRKGSGIALGANLLLGLILIGGVAYGLYRKKPQA